jgi:tRNA A-37 threonylcarbamoyl transferase component Bud32
MADVFRAELVGAEGVTRELVIKKVLHTLSLDREAVEMFVQEARVAARLHHPNVVQVYEFGRTEDGYFLAMELVEGCDLAALFQSHAGSALPLGVVAWVFQELLEALGYVHGLTDGAGRPLGLVHRDVSPHNVLLGRAGEVKLADFGIATASTRTRDEGVKGKYAYMAPEQARGERLDARADLYAVGAMLYEALSGRRALPTRETAAMLDAARRGAIEPIEHVAPSVHPALAAVLGRALAVDRDERFPDAGTFREALAEAMAVAGVVPDRAALQAMVRAYAEARETARADRTLTSQGEACDDGRDGTDTNRPTDASREVIYDALLDDTSGAEASTPWYRRRVFERGMIAVGIFTLAVLAERRTRPVESPRAVVVALPDEGSVRRWFETVGRWSVGAHCRCRVEARFYPRTAVLEGWLRRGEVALAAVSSVALPELLPFVARGREEAFVDLRPTVLRALRAWSAGGAMVPVAVDPVVMAVRREALRDGAARFAARRQSLVAAVDAQVGHGLPGAFTWHDDPSGWNWWDVLAAAWSTRSPAGTGRAGGVALGLSGERGLAAWYALAGPWGDDRSNANLLRGVEETVGWIALFASLGLLAEGPPDPARDVVYVGVARALPGAEGWALFAPPGETPVLAARPRSLPGVALHGEVLGWVTHRTKEADGRVAHVRAACLAAGVAHGLARAWGGVFARGGDGPMASGGGLVDAERLIDGGFVVATSPLRGRSGEGLRALERVVTQAVHGVPRPFVGEGRWWWPTLRSSVSEALGAEPDAGL